MRLVSTVGLLSFVLFGCGPSVDETIQRERPAVDARLASINALAAAVSSTPACPEGRLRLPGPHIDLQMTLVSEQLEQNDFPNTLLLHAEDLPLGPRPPPTLEVRLSGAEIEVFQAARSFAHPDEHTTAASLQRGAELLKRARYLMVVRNASYTPPRRGDATLARNDEGGLDTTVGFTPGRYAAEVLVLSIDDGSVLGCFPFEAQNDEVRIEGATAGDLASLQDGSLFTSQLGGQAKARMLERLLELDPQSDFSCQPYVTHGITLNVCSNRYR